MNCAKLGGRCCVRTRARVKFGLSLGCQIAGGGGRWYWVRYAQEDLLAPECNHRGRRRGRDS